jgi:trehalose 6-phosphate phosphatase
MIRLLAGGGRPVIDEAAARRALLVFDFDGTLAPIVPERRAARMRETTLVLLRTVALAYPTAVISGRSRADVALRISRVPLVGIVGNHGAETPGAAIDGRVRARVEGWAGALLGTLSDAAGIEVEDKGLSLAVHYRRAPDPEAARRRILATAALLPRARVFGGHAVVNVCPAEVPTKGDAVESLALRLKASAVLYVGDDVTDEDAFESTAVTWPVRVGRAEDTAARYLLDRQEEMDPLLEALVTARSAYAREGARAPPLPRRRSPERSHDPGPFSHGVGRDRPARRTFDFDGTPAPARGAGPDPMTPAEASRS